MSENDLDRWMSTDISFDVEEMYSNFRHLASSIDSIWIRVQVRISLGSLYSRLRRTATNPYLSRCILFNKARKKEWILEIFACWPQNLCVDTRVVKWNSFKLKVPICPADSGDMKTISLLIIFRNGFRFNSVCCLADRFMRGFIEIWIIACVTVARRLLCCAQKSLLDYSGRDQAHENTKQPFTARHRLPQQ